MCSPSSCLSACWCSGPPACWASASPTGPRRGRAVLRVPGLAFLYSRPGLAFVLLAVLLAALPFMVGGGLGNSWVRVLDFVLLYMLMAIGLNIVVGYAGLLDLGYIAFYALGAYFYAWLASPHFGLHLPFWMVLPMGAAFAGLFGVLLGAPTLRLRGDYLAIVTLGFGEIIRIFMNNLNAPFNLTNGPQGMNLIDPVKLAGVSFGKPLHVLGMTVPPTYLYYYLFLALTLLAIGVAMRLQDSRVGRAWAALREDEIAAAAMGINTRNTKLLAFAMGATFGGLAGGLFAAFQGFISPESFTLWESILVLCMIVLGGMGNIAGVLLGAALLTIIPEALRYLGDLQRATIGHVVVDPADLRMLLFGVALVSMMLFRPSGLMPSRQRKRELAAEDGVAEQERADLYDSRA
ncbi:MAG: ABC transporter ATP-binding protein [Thiobacillus sp.]|nr:ABC transporter ATP-binding protein [Thiobacillus sp.]